MKILQIIGTMRSEYGGPSFSAAALSIQFTLSGHESTILVLDNEGSSDIPSDWKHYAGRTGGKYAYSRAAFRWLESNIEAFDGVVVHGIWQYQSRLASSICRARGIPYVVFVHGALDPWFKMRYPLKHVKKIVYWEAFERRHLKNARSVLFTSKDEEVLAALDFRLTGLQSTIVPYGIADPLAGEDIAAELSRKRSPPQEIIFLSRIHAKKGLDLLIEAISKYSSLRSVSVAIAGSSSDGEELRLLNLANELHVSERLKWLGMIHGESKWSLYKEASLFCLPSHSENFGLVVAEALACGCPVLITNKVNIWREIRDCGAGIVVDDTRDGVAHGLERWLKMEDSERKSMGRNARDCFIKYFQIRAAERAVLELLR